MATQLSIEFTISSITEALLLAVIGPLIFGFAFGIGSMIGYVTIVTAVYSWLIKADRLVTYALLVESILLIGASLMLVAIVLLGAVAAVFQ